jgi:hypothetical protein
LIGQRPFSKLKYIPFAALNENPRLAFPQGNRMQLAGNNESIEEKRFKESLIKNERQTSNIEHRTFNKD